MIVKKLWERRPSWNWLQRLLGRSDVYFNDSVYMRRWKFIDTRWFGLRLHHIARSDADRELHDHPFTFVSLILSGGYHEYTADQRHRWYGRGSIIFRSAEVLHRLQLGRLVEEGERSAWTLVVRGPYRRQWGFLTKDGWVHWKRFVAERYGVPKRDRPFEAPSST